MRTFLAVVLLCALPASGAEWYEHYEKGVRLIEAGKAVEAKASREAARASWAKCQHRRKSRTR